MPRGDPFSKLCQRAASLAQPIAADLHTHTLASDGDYTPSQILAFAEAAKLKAVAITDHDTLVGYDEARKLESPVRLIPGVELSTLWNGRETHILGLGFDPQNQPLRKLLQQQCELRSARFNAIREALCERGLTLGADAHLESTPSLGRRHIAKMLVKAAHAKSHFDAFQRFLLPLQMPPTQWIGIAEGIGCIRNAGGQVALAHPHSEATETDLRELQAMGMNAVEVSFPKANRTRTAELRTWAANLGLLATGGSDCHGRGTPAIGSHGIGARELAAVTASLSLG